MLYDASRSTINMVTFPSSCTVKNSRQEKQIDKCQGFTWLRRDTYFEVKSFLIYMCTCLKLAFVRERLRGVDIMKKGIPKKMRGSGDNHSDLGW